MISRTRKYTFGDTDGDPSRTRGSLGRRDAGSPNALATLGDTPGTLGVKDYADPDERPKEKSRKLPLPKSESTRSKAWFEFLKAQGAYLPTDKEGSALPGAGHFPGAGFRYTFRTRPIHTFDLAAKIHDLACQMNGVSEYPIEIFSSREKTDPKNVFELSRLAKLDRIFYLMNESVPPSGFPGLLNKLSKLKFRGGRDYLSKHLAYDTFRNPFLDFMALEAMQDPEVYLMIPYDALPKEQQYRCVIGTHDVRGKEVEIWGPDYWRTVPYDSTKGFVSWMKEMYKKHWNYINQISAESGKVVLAPEFQIY